MTDIGHMDSRLISCAAGSDILLIESNHDEELVSSAVILTPPSGAYFQTSAIFPTPAAAGRCAACIPPVCGGRYSAT